MRKEKFLFVHQCPRHSPQFCGWEREAAGRKQKFIKGWQNINLEAHGWPVMHAAQQQAFPSCLCLPVGRDKPPASPAPWALTMTRHSSFAVHLHPNNFPRAGPGRGAKEQSGLQELGKKKT